MTFWVFSLSLSWEPQMFRFIFLKGWHTQWKAFQDSYDSTDTFSQANSRSPNNYLRRHQQLSPVSDNFQRFSLPLKSFLLSPNFIPKSKLPSFLLLKKNWLRRWSNCLQKVCSISVAEIRSLPRCFAACLLLTLLLSIKQWKCTSFHYQRHLDKCFLRGSQTPHAEEDL